MNIKFRKNQYIISYNRRKYFGLHYMHYGLRHSIV